MTEKGKQADSQAKAVQSLKGQVEDLIVDFCQSIINEPLMHFSEADLQVMFAERMHTLDYFKRPWPTGVRRGQGSASIYKTSLLHREYGGGDNTRVDLVAFSHAQAESINDPSLRLKSGSKFEYVKPIFGFEFGTEKSLNTKGHFDNDVKKMQKYLHKDGHGFIVHIQRDATVSQTGSKQRGKTESISINRFKNSFQPRKHLTATSRGISLLALLLRIGRNQKKMQGKLEILDSFDENGSAQWKKVNVSRRVEIKNALTQALANCAI